MVDPREESVELVPPRYEDWREQFLAERTRIQEVLEKHDLATACDRIVHVGSTAVPDLWAKDIVDINVIVDEVHGDADRG